MDEIDMSQDGIKHGNIINFLLDDEIWLNYGVHQSSFFQKEIENN